MICAMYNNLFDTCMNHIYVNCHLFHDWQLSVLTENLSKEIQSQHPWPETWHLKETLNILPRSLNTTTARPKQRQTSPINDKNVNHPFAFVESHVQGILFVVLKIL